MSTIEATLTTGYQVQISGNGHTWLADEPVSSGGADSGPSPYEMLLGALAACTCMTIAMYCQRKEWPLDGIAVRFTHDRVHAKDCEECDQDDKGLLDRVQGTVSVTGDFTDEQRERIQSIAGRCPVNKTLSKGVTIIEDVHVS